MVKENGKMIPVLSGDVSNAGQDIIEMETPYVADVKVRGSSPLLFHRWQSDSVEAKSKAAKGSKAKKTDDVESYVWRDNDGMICLPGEYLRGSMIEPRNGAAKYRQDPRSPRKSALDLFRAGIVSLTNADGEPAESWDFIDRRRVVVQRAGITRERPGFHAGWTAVIRFLVLAPTYIPPDVLHDVLSSAGRMVGVADFRPSFGRFQIDSFDIGLEA
jgi:hypothetical protein